MKCTSSSMSRLSMPAVAKAPAALAEIASDMEGELGFAGQLVALAYESIEKNDGESIKRGMLMLMCIEDRLKNLTMANKALYEVAFAQDKTNK